MCQREAQFPPFPQKQERLFQYHITITAHANPPNQAVNPSQTREQTNKSKHRNIFPKTASKQAFFKPFAQLHRNHANPPKPNPKKPRPLLKIGKARWPTQVAIHRRSVQYLGRAHHSFGRESPLPTYCSCPDICTPLVQIPALPASDSP